jgi:hypothetical protein
MSPVATAQKDHLSNLEYIFFISLSRVKQALTQMPVVTSCLFSFAKKKVEHLTGGFTPAGKFNQYAEREKTTLKPLWYQNSAPSTKHSCGGQIVELQQSVRGKVTGNRALR